MHYAAAGRKNGQIRGYVTKLLIISLPNRWYGWGVYHVAWKKNSRQLRSMKGMYKACTYLNCHGESRVHRHTTYNSPTLNQAHNQHYEHNVNHDKKCAAFTEPIEPRKH